MIDIVWFKRDLRLADHSPLVSATNTGRPIIPLYVVEPKYWDQPYSAPRHWWFIHDCLTELRQLLQNRGNDLIIRVGSVTDILNTLHKNYSIHTIHSHEETGPMWTYHRDILVDRWCDHHNVNWHEYPSNGVIRGLDNRDGWAKKRNTRMNKPVYPAPDHIPGVKSITPGQIPEKNDPIFGSPVDPAIFKSIQSGGRNAGIQALRQFLNNDLGDYLPNISSPIQSDQTCSRLSTHLAYGCLSAREVEATIKSHQKNATLSKQERRGLSAVQSRLAWRDHFIQKLEQHPSIEDVCLHPYFENLRKNDLDTARLNAWKNGQTGYPLIDAAMRCLRQTGWVTFRMRALLASFASYHLWLDWRHTANYLARCFTDFEAGIHFSQMQMQSGTTGINTFRIYNPIKQSMDQDPEGGFIRRWVNELDQVPAPYIHQPWVLSNHAQQRHNCHIGRDYPQPIVNHDRAIAIARDKIAGVIHRPGYDKIANQIYRKLGSRKRPRRINHHSKKPNHQLKLGLSD